MLLQNRDVKRGHWEYLRTPNLVEAVHKAKELGWAENKVQVKQYSISIDEVEYAIEPFDGCHCSNLMEYEDYFLHESGPIEPVLED